jgi:hypothetical protein
MGVKFTKEKSPPYPDKKIADLIPFVAPVDDPVIVPVGI